MLAEMLAWRPPSGGSRSVGVSLQPAIPRRVAPQLSPLPLHQSPTIVAQSQCGVWLRSSVALVVSAPNGVSSLLCTPSDILFCADIRGCFETARRPLQKVEVSQTLNVLGRRFYPLRCFKEASCKRLPEIPAFIIDKLDACSCVYEIRFLAVQNSCC